MTPDCGIPDGMGTCVHGLPWTYRDCRIEGVRVAKIMDFCYHLHNAPEVGR